MNRFRFVLLIVTVVGSTALSVAQPTPLYCTSGEVGGGAGVPLDNSLIAFQDTLRTLVVLVRFNDDFEDDPNGFPNTWRSSINGVPIPPRLLPSWGHDLVFADPNQVSDAYISAADSSLSASFYLQSRNGPAGPHVLYGDVWPRNALGTPEVYVTEHPEVYYRADSLVTTPRG